MKATIITIGNELLIGDTVNTNAAWIGTFLSSHNIEPVKAVTIGDDAHQIRDSLDDGLALSDIVIMTGGLGPTHDDITKKILADYFDSELTVHEPTKTFIEKIFKKRGIPLSDSNLEQSMVPEKCTVLFNKNGTAPGMWFEKDGNIVVSIPGVPFEMKALMENEVLPRLRSATGITGYQYRHYIQTAGIGESTLSDLVIGDVGEYLKNGTELAYLPHVHGITLRLSVWGVDEAEAEKKAEKLLKHIRNAAGNYIYSEEKDDTLQAAVGRLLGESDTTIATAESCTGGLIGNKITDIPGSSAWFRGGVIAYSNDLKVNLLNVKSETIEKFGAVSKETALEMAEGAAKLMNADIAVSVTGVAGPGGGTDSKPVGLVWFGYYDKKNHFAIRAQFFKDRILNKERSALVALEIVRRVRTGIEQMPYDLTPESVS